MAKIQARQYVMENAAESTRLENQAGLPAYSVEAELRGISVSPGACVLDAGCGTGVVARYLAEKFPGAQVEGCDFSAMRVQSAKLLAASAGAKIRYFESQLEQIRADDGAYDLVACRYVFEHLADARIAAREFFRVLRPGGTALVIDADGVIYNLYPLSGELATLVARVREGLGTDLHVGRKIPSMLVEAGFKEVSWQTTVEDFQGEALDGEREMCWQRLTFAAPILARILGGENQATRFKDLYCAEMMKPGATLFYNKFVVTGKK